jgi:putative heme-binding domain-containing protein
MRDILTSNRSQDSSRLRAVTILEADDSSKNLKPLLSQLDNEALAARVIPMLIRFDGPKVAEALIAHLSNWPEQLQAEAMGVLVSRKRWAHQVLDAVESGGIPENQLTAFHVRQIDDLGDPALRKRLATQWGSLSQSSQERRNEIAELVGLYQTAPLWAYSAEAGAGHFKKLCATCHQGDSEGVTVAPKIAGSRLKGVAYLVENILDPNAVIGRDFQARNVLTIQGLVVTGLVENETDSAVMIRTATNTVTIAKDDIEEIRVSKNSFMPEGLLKALNDRERLELLKYLMSL